jgi:hypothetical protein
MTPAMARRPERQFRRLEYAPALPPTGANLNSIKRILGEGMHRLCCERNCDRKAASRFSRYCSAHKSRARRHGDANQANITERELKPYRQYVQKRISKNRDSRVWPALEVRWQAVISHAKHIIDGYFAGNAGNRFERIAAQEVVKLGMYTAPPKIIETVLAMVMMLQFERHRFVSDNGFRTQVVRRVRALSDVNFGESHQHETGRIKRYYRDLPQRSVAILSSWIIEALGGAAVYVSKLEQSDRDRAIAEKRDLGKALAELG